MRSLSDHFKDKDLAMKEFMKHPRFKYLEEIFRLVNTDRKGTKYKPLPIKVFAVKTGHLNLTDLDYLVKQMRASGAPGKVFFGALKVKKN
jgi:hypothetical protein